jgi:hypothetical protein
MSGKAPAPWDMRQWREGYFRRVASKGGEEAMREERARAVSK